MGYRKTLCVDARAGRRQEKGDAMRNHPEDARGFGRVGQIVPRVMKEIDRRCDLRHRLRAEWGREPSDDELLAVAQESGGTLLEDPLPFLRKDALGQSIELDRPIQALEVQE